MIHHNFTFPHVPAVSWPHVIGELKRTHGMSLRDIGSAINNSPETIRAWHYGINSPRHADGERLIALWIKTTSKQRESLPTSPTQFTAAQVRSL